MNSHSHSDQQSALLDLLWTERRPRRRGPVPTADLAEIARTGVGMADSGGLGSMSMQRVAEALGLTKMAIYRYVSSKSELVALVIEAAVGEPPRLDRNAGWREQIEQWADLLRATWQVHPWLPAAAIGNRVMGPNEVGWIEAALDALEGTNLTNGEKLDAVVVLCGHVRTSQDVPSYGTQPWTLDEHLQGGLLEILEHRSRDFPLLLRVIGSKVESHNNVWRFGLQSLLEGIEVITRSRSPLADQSHG